MTVPGDRNPEHLEILEALKHLPTIIETETAGLAESVLRARPGQDEWSIKETVGHLRDYTELTYKRVAMICHLTDPVVPALPPEGEVESVRSHNYQDADLRALVAEISELRLKTVDLLSNAVDWTRLGQQPRVGRRSLKQFTERAVRHEANHLAQIRALKAQQGAVV